MLMSAAILSTIIMFAFASAWMLMVGRGSPHEHLGRAEIVVALFAVIPALVVVATVWVFYASIP